MCDSPFSQPQILVHMKAANSISHVSIQDTVIRSHLVLWKRDGFTCSNQSIQPNINIVISLVIFNVDMFFVFHIQQEL